LDDCRTALYPLVVQRIHGGFIGQRQAHFTATARQLGRWLHGMARPQTQLYSIVENKQGEGGVELHRRLAQQAAIEVGAGGRAVDVEQKVMGDGGHAGSWGLRV